MPPYIMSPEVTSSNYHFLINVLKDWGKMLTELNKTTVVSRICFSLHHMQCTGSLGKNIRVFTRFAFHAPREISWNNSAAPGTCHCTYTRARRSAWHLLLRNTWNKLIGSCITENADVCCHIFVNVFIYLCIICRYSSCGTAVAVAMTVDSRQATPAPPAATTWTDRRRQAQTPASLGCPRHQRERWRRRRRRLKKMKRTRPAAAGRRTVRRLRLPPSPPPPGAGERRGWPPAAPCSPPTPWRCICNQRHILGDRWPGTTACLHCKKRLAIFLSRAEMSLTKVSLGGKT